MKVLIALYRDMGFKYLLTMWMVIALASMIPAWHSYDGLCDGSSGFVWTIGPPDSCSFVSYWFESHWPVALFLIVLGSFVIGRLLYTALTALTSKS
jgi:hypothetical protein